MRSLAPHNNFMLLKKINLFQHSIDFQTSSRYHADLSQVTFCS